MTAIKVPPLGESIVEATVSRWLKNEGDAVAPGESLVELETDKVTVEVPAMIRGVLTKRLHAEGDVVKVDEILCEIDESATAAPTQASPDSSVSPEAPAVAQPLPSATTTVAPPSEAAARARPPERQDVRASPAARRVAAEEHVDLGAVQGTGRGGVVSKPDVIDHTDHIEQRPAAAETRSAPQALAQNDATRTPAGSTIGGARPGTAPGSSDASAREQREVREKLSTRRKRMAEHLLEAQHATAHLTTFNEIDMSAVSALRQRLKERVEKEHGVKLSFMPFFVKAACIALEAHPFVNAQIDGDSIVYKRYVNMGIAVASDAGLVVPNIKDADRKGMLEVARDIIALAKKARDGKLTMDDLTGGSFTITNGGVFGSLVSTPILNYPQSGILGLHKIQDRPIAVDGRVEIRPMMYIALSYDHRVIDGQQAVLFLVRIKELMEDPGAMLLQ